MSRSMVDVLEELDRAGAVLLKRHFVYTSGKHGSAYINLDPLFPNVGLVSQLGNLLVKPFVGQVDTVIAPATGGIVLSVLAARALVDRGYPVAATWADKHDDGFVVERAGFAEHLRDKRVLVVEDLLNTGGSVEKVCREAERHGGQLVGVSVICNRGSLTADKLRVPRLEALVSVSFEAIPADECPLCESAVPIVVDIGHGAKYRIDHPGYAGGYVTMIGA